MDLSPCDGTMNKRALSREEVERFRAEAGPPVGAPTDSDIEAAWPLLPASVQRKANRLRASRVVVTLDRDKAASQNRAPGLPRGRDVRDRSR
jgi:hypothetical protein